MKKFFAFLTSKTFVANVVLAVVGGLLFLWGISFFLDSYTHHGEKIVVPNLSNLTLNEADDVLQEQKLSFEVIDSSEYNELFPPFSVIDQFPEANAEVKEGRVISLTINPSRARLIELPNIIEKTLRRAIHELESRGLKAGQLIYVPDLGRDVVIGMQVNTEELEPGVKLEKGTVVDLVVGQGLSNEKINVPYLKYLTLKQAQDKMKLASLNQGILFYDDEIEDTATAVVYRHLPKASKEPYIRIGSSIDLWLTNDYNKIVNDSLEFIAPKDSTLIDSINSTIDTTKVGLGE